MSSRSVGGTPLRLSGERSEDDEGQGAFDAVPATTIDPHPAIGGRFRHSQLEELEGLRPSETPTRESKDVIQALVARESSIAQARQRPEPPTPPVELDLPLLDAPQLLALDEPGAPAVEDDFESCLPTTVKQPQRTTSTMRLPRLDGPEVKVIERERLRAWSPARERGARPARSPSVVVWRVLLVCAGLATLSLLLVLIWTRGGFSLGGAPVVEAAEAMPQPRVAEPPAPVGEPPAGTGATARPERPRKMRVARKPAPEPAAETVELAPVRTEAPAAPSAPALEGNRPNPF